MFNRINRYIFINLLKSFFLIFFIFLSISWLLQLTRLLTLTNFVQIDIINIVYLSLFIIPNLISTILPFILIFGILLCFIKLNKDKEIIAIASLGMQLKPIKFCLYFFTIILSFVYISLNSYISPKVYEIYKFKENELRNTINIDKMVFSNFLKINQNTVIDFKKNNNLYENIFINYTDENENLIFAKKGSIKNENNNFLFQLNNGFKLNIKVDSVEKLEFDNYLLKIENQSNLQFNTDDKNTFTIFDDFITENYLNISYKLFDLFITIFIVYIFYNNNISKLDFGIKNNIYFIFFSIILLIVNQLIKNSEMNIQTYITSIFVVILSILIFLRFKNYE